MNEKQIAAFKAQIVGLLNDIETQDDLGADAQKTVTLDQQSVGRLSRMDALQQQAMAQATQTRRAQMTARLRAALARIDDGEFGYCVECGDTIAPARLSLDPASPTCITCASG